MRGFAGATWVRHGLALAAVAVALGLRFALDRWLGNEQPFVLFLGAVIVAAWIGGAAPALLAAVAGYLAARFFFIEPRGTLAISDAAEAASLLVYAISSLLIVGIGGAMHTARRRTDASEERFRRFMENAAAAVFIKDEAGHYLYMNPAAERITGSRDWQGKTDAELLPEAAALEIRAHDRQVLESNSPESFASTASTRSRIGRRR